MWAGCCIMALSFCLGIVFLDEEKEHGVREGLVWQSQYFLSLTKSRAAILGWEKEVNASFSLKIHLIPKVKELTKWLAMRSCGWGGSLFLCLICSGCEVVSSSQVWTQRNFSIRALWQIVFSNYGCIYIFHCTWSSCNMTLTLFHWKARSAFPSLKPEWTFITKTVCGRSNVAWLFFFKSKKVIYFTLQHYVFINNILKECPTSIQRSFWWIYGILQNFFFKYSYIYFHTSGNHSRGLIAKTRHCRVQGIMHILSFNRYCQIAFCKRLDFHHQCLRLPIFSLHL